MKWPTRRIGEGMVEDDPDNLVRVDFQRKKIERNTKQAEEEPALSLAIYSFRAPSRLTLYSFLEAIEAAGEVAVLRKVEQNIKAEALVAELWCSIEDLNRLIGLTSNVPNCKQIHETVDQFSLEYNRLL